MATIFDECLYAAVFIYVSHLLFCRYCSRFDDCGIFTVSLPQNTDFIVPWNSLYQRSANNAEEKSKNLDGN